MQIHPTIERILKRRLTNGYSPEDPDALRIMEQGQTVEGRREIANFAADVLSSHRTMTQRLVKQSKTMDAVRCDSFKEKLKSTTDIIVEGEEIYAIALTDYERRDKTFRRLREVIDSLAQGGDSPARAPRPGRTDLACFLGQGQDQARLAEGHVRHVREHRPRASPPGESQARLTLALVGSLTQD